MARTAKAASAKVIGNTAEVIELKPTVTRDNFAVSMIMFQGEMRNVNNMLTMSKGDQYMQYAEMVCTEKGDKKNAWIDRVNYPTIRKALVDDLNKAPTTTVKEGEKTITMYPWGKQAIGMKAHSLACGIVKTVEKRSLTFNEAGRAVDVVLFDKWDKKADNGNGDEVTRKATVNSKTVFLTYDRKAAMSFLARFK